MATGPPSNRSMQPLHLLVVEDELKLLNNLCRGLSEEGFAVLSAGSAEAAEHALANGEFDAIVLDLRLPGKDGLEFLRGLRASGNAVPVLILTARGSVGERVAGLETGADDYLVKPFALRELLARVRALLRRAEEEDEPEHLLEFEDLRMDVRAHEAWRGTRLLSLTRTEFLLLEMFLRHPRKVLTRSAIFEHVWGYDFGSTSNSLGVYIGYLRRKTEVGDEPRLLHTVRGVGYVLRTAR
jgi:two-component system response regulator MprA